MQELNITIGAGLQIAIPPTIAAELDFAEGDALFCRVQDGTLVLTKEKRG